MKNIIGIISLTLTLSLSGCSKEKTAINTIDFSEQTPNVVLIYIDDQGWVDTSVQMDDNIPQSKSDFYETPNIALLAKQGIRFSDAYSASPICSPARASLLTGISPQRLGITDIIGSQPGSKRYSDYYVGKALIPQPPLVGLPLETKTIAEILKEQVPSVVTAHFGKWHVGSGGPEQNGFDEGDSASGNGTSHGGNAFVGDPNPKNIFGITESSIDFMKRSVATNRPFYLQISHYAVHSPAKALAKTYAKYKARKAGDKHNNAHYAAMNEDVDTSVGMILQAIDDLNIEGNTYVIFTSDNGGSMDIRHPATNNAPLAKGKTWVWEGGIRVPMFVRGPGITSGTQTDKPVIGWDIMPTICAMMGCDKPLPNDVEGGDLLPLMRGESTEVSRPRGDTLVWSFPHYLTIKGTTPQVAIREGDFKMIKLIETGEKLMFNLRDDIGETNNISTLYPAQVKILSDKLDAYLGEVGARMPIRNDMLAGPQKPSLPVIITKTSSAVECTNTKEIDGPNTHFFKPYSHPYLGISFCYPENWALDIEDQSVFISDKVDSQLWEKYDPSQDFYLTVSHISPWLHTGDQEKNRLHSLESFAEATVNSLGATEYATLENELIARNVGGFDSISFSVQQETRFHYQVIIRLGLQKMVTIAVNGLLADKDRLTSVVDLMVRSLKPLGKVEKP